MSTADVATEKHEFQTEVTQLLKLMIHSLYSNKEIFLRELVSNASDACDKLRFEALSNGDLYESDGELKIRVDFDSEAKTLTVSDNGIGMSRDEVIQNIGTIAKSGTKAFLDSLTGDQKEDARLIGQFGVGFYSSFIVADRVTLVTRRAGEPADSGVLWASDGSGAYELGTTEKAERGTSVTLHLREDSEEFLDNWRLRGIVKKYSDHITFPVMMLEQQFGEEEEKKEPGYEAVNSASALWTKAKRDISEEEYKEFYKQSFHDFDEPLAWSHNRVEGRQEYTSLLYVPKRAPFDLYERDSAQGIKLYVQRVFIMDDSDKIMPRYMRFVRGLVDSNDLPLNVSREILQSNKVIDAIRTASVKKVLGLLENMAKNEPEDYKVFWEQFGKVMKEGPAEDFANKEQLGKLFRFSSTHDDSEKQETSLDDYISRMQPGQEKIYYIAADSFAAAKNSPHLEVFRKKGIEVILMHDRVDDWMMSYFQEYDGKKFHSAAKGDLELGDVEDTAEKEAKKASEEDAKGLIERIKGVVDAKVSGVKVSHRLTSSPACLVLGEQDMALHMQQLMKQAGHDVPSSKPTFEINVDHPMVKKMDGEQDEDRFQDWALLMYDQAVLAEGGQLEDGASFVRRMNELLMALDKD